MKFTAFLPPIKSPVLYYLSGLTCNEDNFITKGGAIRRASELGLALIAPDTSPRGLVIQGHEVRWDIGEGASFYVNATTEKWMKYKMFTYITVELFNLCGEFVDNSKASIFGHSMGGHGALIAALKTNNYKSVSAFAPICNPSQSDWGKIAFKEYMNSDGKDYDATELSKAYAGPPLDVMIDQGTKDQFYISGQLMTEAIAAVKNENVRVDIRMREGFDHSYWFVQTFMNEHIDFHYKHLS